MIQSIKSILLRSIKSKRINVFLLFLALSFMFLLLTKLTQDYTKTITFDAKPFNAEENFVILSDSTHNLDITLSSYGFKFLKYYLTNPTVTVDLSNIDHFDKQYIWTNRNGLAHLNTQFSESVKVLAVNPDSLVFKYDISGIKKVPVILNSKVVFAPGYDILESYKVIPDSIKVIGPQILLDSIISIKTKLLSLERINTNINERLNVILPDSSENLVYSHKSVNISGHIEKFTEGSIEVPVDITNVPDSLQINYFPKTINVLYYTSLTNFKNITTSDFIVECDFSSLNSESSKLEPKLVKYPKNVKNVKLSQKQIEFVISK